MSRTCRPAKIELTYAHMLSRDYAIVTQMISYCIWFHFDNRSRAVLSKNDLQMYGEVMGADRPIGVNKFVAVRIG